MSDGVIPDKFTDLFDKKVFANLATLMPDGRPQVTPVWCEFDGTHILVNSAQGRQKDRNMRRDPRVSLSVMDPDNSYRYIEVRGEVVEIEEDSNLAHINKLAKKYMDLEEYPYLQAGEVRIRYKIQPQHTTSMDLS
jgi:PPOX class probable F420-dependent enzyme